MIHRIVQYLARVTLWFAYRKIYFDGEEKRPKPATFIYALNHPTAFLDPVVLASNVSQRCWTLLRGDMFARPVIRWLLHKISNVPIVKRDMGSDGL